MAKARKTRRAKRRRSTRGRQRRASSAASESTVTTPQATPTGFTEEYQYVIADLRRIFFLAAVMLASLLILAYVLR